MASFTGKIPTPTDGFTLKVVYTLTASDNYDYVTVDTTGYVKRNNSAYYPSSSYATAKMTIAGNTKTLDGNVSYNLDTDSYDKIITYSKNVYLTDDGTSSGTEISSKTFTIKLTFDGNRSSYYPKGSISKSITVTREKYNISYDANGGTGAPSDDIKYKGMPYTLSTVVPTKEGYTFSHWNREKDGSGATNFKSGGNYTGNVDTVFYAQWKKTITLSFDTNGVAESIDSLSTTVYNDTTTASFTIPNTTLTRSGYTFLGWGTSSTDKTPKYNPGDTVTLSESTKIYAIWEKSLALVYNMNGGEGTISPQTANIYNATTSYTFSISDKIPTYEGHSFLGWSTSSTATTASYSVGGNITISKDTILYAVWETCNYTITLDANGGECSTYALGLIYNSDKNNDISAYNPTYIGYEFLGWYTSPIDGVQVYDAEGKCTNDGTYWGNGLCIYSGNYTLYAHWKLLNVAYIIKDGTPQLCYTYYKKDGAWYKAIMYKNVDNTYKQSVI